MQPRITRQPAQKHFLAAFFLSFMWGVFGVDRMYLGKWVTGVFKLLTLGGLGIWALVDLASIMGGTMRDAQRRPLLQHADYKGFAAKMVTLFALAVLAVVIINGAVAIITVTQLMNELQGGGGLPGLDFLNGTRGLTPEQVTELGL